MAKDYDIGEAFAAIEEELIASMMRNMRRHRLEEIAEDREWEMWQAMQLRSLENYKRENRKKYGAQFQDINHQIEDVIRQANLDGQMDQEIEILEALRQGYSGYHHADDAMTAQFFRLNDRKLDALINATTNDMQSAETAVLRRANDEYRKVIYNAQVYANTGAGTYEKAVDMATKDFLAAGIQCVQYKNGAMHTLSDYADMAIRTASKRAYLQGEGTKRQEWGIHTVIVNKRGNPCPKCLPFCGKVLIDDVWSGGSRKDGSYPLMSAAVAAGLYHPRCKDSHTTYFPGISTADDTWTKEELQAVGENTKQEAKEQYAERQAEKYGRLARYSLDEENQESYSLREEFWNTQIDFFDEGEKRRENRKKFFGRVYFRTGNMSSREYANSKRPLANFMATPSDRVVEILREDSKSWIEKLTGKEKYAIRKYTYNSGDKKPNRFFERLNAMLRGERPKDNRLQEYADTISTAIKKGRIKRDVIAYRGMDVDPVSGALTGNIRKIEQFFSSSVVESQAFGGKYFIILYVNKGARASYIEQLSHFRKQRELLIDKDCFYRVISRQGDTIELEVLSK